MWIADQWQDYELLDCGGGEKLERWDKQYPGASGPPGHLGDAPATSRRGSGPTHGISAARPAAATGRRKALPESWTGAL